MAASLEQSRTLSINCRDRTAQPRSHQTSSSRLPALHDKPTLADMFDNRLRQYAGQQIIINLTLHRAP